MLSIPQKSTTSWVKTACEQPAQVLCDDKTEESVLGQAVGGGLAQRGAHPGGDGGGGGAGVCAEEAASELLMERWRRFHQRWGQVKEAKDIPDRGWIMSKAEKHEIARYF